MDKLYPNLQYNKNLKGYAVNMRNDGTKAEAWLWKFVLRAKQMKGYSFNRQRPVLNYIADFMCKDLKLVIELDGLTHLDEAVQTKDLQKTQDLTANGYTVLRFSDNDVMNNLDWVKSQIEETVDRLEASL